MCEEFSRCYNDINICLWMNGSGSTQSVAEAVCQQRNSFLPRITNRNIEPYMIDFRNATGIMLYTRGFWIDVKAVAPGNWHWIDGSAPTGLLLSMCIMAFVAV